MIDGEEKNNNFQKKIEMDKDNKKLEDLVNAFCIQCQDALEKMAIQMVESDRKMQEYQDNVDRLKVALDEQIKTNEYDMHQVKQALTDLCDSI